MCAQEMRAAGPYGGQGDFSFLGRLHRFLGMFTFFAVKIESFGEPLDRVGMSWISPGVHELCGDKPFLSLNLSLCNEVSKL